MQEMQTVLKEPLCARICGGKLDFPRHASFSAIKIVAWWEVEFQAAFKHRSGLSNSTEQETVASAGSGGGVIKTIQPSEFVLVVVDTAEQLLGTMYLFNQRQLRAATLEERITSRP